MIKKTKISPRRATNDIPPKEYAQVFLAIKCKVLEAQVDAAVAANKVLINLYWSVGEIIVQRQETKGWGSKLIEQIAQDLQDEFPGIEGFSRSNIFRMRAFYLEYKSIAASYENFTDIPEVNILSQIPWSHNIVLFEKVSSVKERLWYAHKTLESGWSRDILAMQIDSGLYRRQGKAVTNFTRTLPVPHSDLAQQSLKDPYLLDFLGLHDVYTEREVEQGLIDHIQKFLLELGHGFAFVGRQVHLIVDEQDYYIDLLFYHLKLHRYVVIELKAGVFNPRDAGQIGFYLAAVDDKLKTADDQPTIGLILCRSKRKLTIEYALRATTNPIAVSSYATKLLASLPKNLKSSFPSVKEIEAGIEKKETMIKLARRPMSKAKRRAKK